MVLVSTAYLPPVSYMALLVQQRAVLLEAHEHFAKQTYRNRCVIYGPNGLQNLTVPVERSGWREPIKDLRISYAENWVDNHWRALASAYNNSPFFAVLGDDIRKALDKKPVFLLDLNLELLATILDWLQDSSISWSQTEQYMVDYKLDFRQRISPKQTSILVHPQPYYQQFADRHGFQPDLSVIDLIFHEGRAAWDYLNEATLSA